jgi:hypothetical protein
VRRLEDPRQLLNVIEHIIGRLAIAVQVDLSEFARLDKDSGHSDRLPTAHIGVDVISNP